MERSAAIFFFFKKRRSETRNFPSSSFPSFSSLNSHSLSLSRTKQTLEERTHENERTCDGRDERPQRHDGPDLDARQAPVRQVDGRERVKSECAVRREVPALGHGERGEPAAAAAAALYSGQGGGGSLGRDSRGDGRNGLNSPILFFFLLLLLVAVALDDRRVAAAGRRRRRWNSAETHELRRRRAPAKPLEARELPPLALGERGSGGLGRAAAPGERGDPSDRRQVVFFFRK